MFTRSLLHLCHPSLTEETLRILYTQAEMHKQEVNAYIRKLLHADRFPPTSQEERMTYIGEGNVGSE